MVAGPIQAGMIAALSDNKHVVEQVIDIATDERF